MMYCSFCGAQIADESKYCSSCGKLLAKIEEGAYVAKAIDNGHKPIFKKSHIVICGLWWTFVCVLVLLVIWSNHSSHYLIENVFLPMFIIYNGIPLLIYTYYFIKRRKSNNHNLVIDVGGENSEEDSKLENVDNSVSLRKFAAEHGKMQVCRYLNDVGTLASKCVFTKSSGDNTEKLDVFFAPSLGALSATDIQANCDNLVVVKNADDEYLLESKSGANIVKSALTATPPPLDKISTNNQ